MFESVPRPIRDAAQREARRLLSGRAGASALLTAAVGYGVTSAATSNAIAGLLGAIPGVVAAAGALWTKAEAAWNVLRDAEPETTPITDPGIGEGRHRRSLVLPTNQAHHDSQ